MRKKNKVLPTPDQGVTSLRLNLRDRSGNSSSSESDVVEEEEVTTGCDGSGLPTPGDSTTSIHPNLRDRSGGSSNSVSDVVEEEEVTTGCFPTKKKKKVANRQTSNTRGSSKKKNRKLFAFCGGAAAGALSVGAAVPAVVLASKSSRAAEIASQSVKIAELETLLHHDNQLIERLLKLEHLYIQQNWNLTTKNLELTEALGTSNAAVLELLKALQSSAGVIKDMTDTLVVYHRMALQLARDLGTSNATVLELAKTLLTYGDVISYMTDALMTSHHMVLNLISALEITSAAVQVLAQKLGTIYEKLDVLVSAYKLLEKLATEFMEQGFDLFDELVSAFTPYGKLLSSHYGEQMLPTLLEALPGGIKDLVQELIEDLQTTLTHEFSVVELATVQKLSTKAMQDGTAASTTLTENVCASAPSVTECVAATSSSTASAANVVVPSTSLTAAHVLSVAASYFMSAIQLIAIL